MSPLIGGARTLLALAKASHPGPVAAVSAAAAGYALVAGGSPREAARVGRAVLFGQLAIGWQNDWIDAERDARSGRTDKPISNQEISRHTVGVAAILAGVAAIPASLACGRRGGAKHLAAIASAGTYNAGIKSTAASFAPYGFSFGLLPMFVHDAVEGAGSAPYWAPSAAGLLGVAAHLVNVLPDRTSDRDLGVLGLPQRLQPEKSLELASALLALSSALVTFGPKNPGRSDFAGFLISLGLGALVVRTAAVRNDRSAFHLVLLVALSNVAQLLVSVHDSARRSQQEDRARRIG